MTPLELLTPAETPDAWHDVRAPGGYEWWYFDAEELAGNRQLVAIFLDGFVFHPGYLRKYFKYERNPTKHLPPVPHDFVCAYFVVYRDGRIEHQFMTHYPAREFEASRDEPRLRIGGNSMARVGDAFQVQLTGTPWKLTWQGPKLLVDQKLEADLQFTTQLAHAPQERRFFSPDLASADHQWVIANPLCDVRGNIRVGSETIVFNGRGYHDHNYGTGPIGPGLKRWFWGRALFDDAAVTFHYAIPRDRTLGDELHLVEADAQSIREVTTANVECDWSRRTMVQLRYPNQARFGDVLSLSNPRVIDSAPFYMRLNYEADYRGRKGSAFCEIAYPHRLRWPILGRMIEMSIDQQYMRI